MMAYIVSEVLWGGLSASHWGTNTASFYWTCCFAMWENVSYCMHIIHWWFHIVCANKYIGSKRHFRENILHIPNYGITIMLIPKLGSLLLDKPFKVHNEHILLRVVRYQAYTKYSQRVSSFMYYIDASLIGWMKILWNHSKTGSTFTSRPLYLCSQNMCICWIHFLNLNNWISTLKWLFSIWLHTTDTDWV